MKILYHHRTRGDGAEGVHIQEMATAFEELGHTVEFCSPRNAKREPGLLKGMTGMSAAESAGLIGGLRLRFRQSLEIAYNAVSFSRICWHVLHYRPDIIYERYSCYHVAGVAAARMLRVPLLLEVNSTYSGRFARRELGFPRVAKWMEKYALGGARGIAVVSNPLRECVQDREVDVGRIVVTPNAVNAGKIAEYAAPALQKRIRKELGLEGQVVIGFVGSLRRWHGVDMLVRRIPDVLKRVPNASFLIVGAGELEDSVKALVDMPELTGRVIATGGVPHARAMELITAMDIGLMPHSNAWGSPMKILEYMALGKVTIAPRLPPIEEILLDGSTGYLFEPRNEQQFTELMVNACQSQQIRLEIGAQARDFVLNNRRWTDNALLALKLLEHKNV